MKGKWEENRIRKGVLLQILKIQVALLYYTILERKKQCVLVKIYKEIECIF